MRFIYWVGYGFDNGVVEFKLVENVNVGVVLSLVGFVEFFLSDIKGIGIYYDEFMIV